MFSLSRTLFVILCLLGIGVKSSFAQAGPTVSISAVQIGVPGQVGALNVTASWTTVTPFGTSIEIKLSECTIVNGQPVVTNPARIYRRTFPTGPNNGGTTTGPFTGHISGMMLWPEVTMFSPNLAVLAHSSCFPVTVP